MLAIDKQLYSLLPKRGIDPMVLGGILNSDWIALFRETDGRTIMGEGMNRNEVQVYEARHMPIPDISKFSKKEAEKIKSIFKKLLLKSRTSSESELLNYKRELNKAVLSTIGMSEYSSTLEEAVKRLIEMRIEGGGMQKEVMLEKEPLHLIKLKGSQVVSTTILDDFM